MKNSHMGETLLEMIAKSPYSIEDVSNHLGVSRQTVYALKKTPNPKTDTVAKILELIKVPPNSYFSYIIEDDVTGWVAEEEAPYGYSKVPLLNAMVAAGIPREVDMLHAEEYPSIRIHASMLRPSNGYIALQVSGDSMQPTLRDGDWVIVEQVTDWGTMRAGKLYVWVSDSGATVKRLASRTASDVVLSSDNTQYEAQTLPKSAVLQVFEVKLWVQYA